jgi:hypothetical protein
VPTTLKTANPTCCAPSCSPARSWPRSACSASASARSLRHTAAAITTFAGITFVVPVMLIFAGAGPNTHGFGKYLLIFIAGNSVGAVKPVTCPTSGGPCPHFLSPWAGIAVTALYAATALTSGLWLLTRRDA